MESGILKYRARLNKLLAKAVEISRNEFAIADTMVKNDDKFQRLNLRDIKLIFEILMMGQILPLIAVLYEISLTRTFCLKRTMSL